MSFKELVSEDVSCPRSASTWCQKEAILENRPFAPSLTLSAKTAIVTSTTPMIHALRLTTIDICGLPHEGCIASGSCSLGGLHAANLAVDCIAIAEYRRLKVR